MILWIEHRSTNDGDNDNDDDVSISFVSIEQILFDLPELLTLLRKVFFFSCILVLRCMLLLLPMLLEADDDDKTSIDEIMKGITSATCSRMLIISYRAIQYYWSIQPVQ